MVRKHPNIILVTAHPGEYATYCRHLNRLQNRLQHLDKLLEPKYAVQYNGTDGSSMEWA